MLASTVFKRGHTMLQAYDIINQAEAVVNAHIALHYTPAPHHIYVGPVPIDEVDILQILPRKQEELVNILEQEASDVYYLIGNFYNFNVTAMNWWLASTQIGDHIAIDLVRKHEFDDLRYAAQLLKKK